MNTEEYNERRLKANQKLLETIQMIDPADPEAAELFNAATKLYHELNEDIKVQLNHEEEVERQKTENRKIDSEASIKAKAIKMEKSKTDSEAKSEKRRATFDLIGKFVIGASTVVAAGIQLLMFWRSTEKEKEEAYLTETDKTVVRNGLSGKWWK